jgi:hypothetical protein
MRHPRSRCFPFSTMTSYERYRGPPFALTKNRRWQTMAGKVYRGLRDAVASASPKPSTSSRTNRTHG